MGSRRQRTFATVAEGEVSGAAVAIFFPAFIWHRLA